MSWRQLPVEVEAAAYLLLHGPAFSGGERPTKSSTSLSGRAEPDEATRLLVRERYAYTRPWAPLLVEPTEAVSFVMSQKMLRGIRDRAERTAARLQV